MKLALDAADLEVLRPLLRDLLTEVVRDELARAVPRRRDDRPAEPLVVPLDETARLLSCSQRGVERLIASGELPAVRLDSRVRVARKDIVHLIEQRKQAPAKAG